MDIPFARSIRVGIPRAIIIIALLLSVAAQAAAQSREPMTAADVEALVTELSNWGRWGKDDQLGALNLITRSEEHTSELQSH